MNANLEKFPGLLTLLSTYSTWLLTEFHDPMIVWVIIVVGILLLGGVVHPHGQKIRDGLASLF